VSHTDEKFHQLQVQLAGCLTAAEGMTKGPNIPRRGDYGWSVAYQRTLILRRKYDDLRKQLRKLIENP
jgi:hypothetical protein